MFLTIILFQEQDRLLKLLDSHEVVIVPAKDFNGKFNTNYNFMELGITNED